MLQAHTNLPGLHSLVEHPTTRETWCRAPSHKLQGTSSSRSKLQAASFKQGWFESFINFQGASGKHQAPSNKHQAASHELRAL
jgi:hypothetical protein